MNGNFIVMNGIAKHGYYTFKNYSAFQIEFSTFCIFFKKYIAELSVVEFITY